MLQSFKKRIKWEFDSLRQFTLFPRDHKHTTTTDSEKLRRILALIVIELPLMVISILVMVALEEFANLDLGDHVIEEMLKENTAIIAFYGIILAPLLEEFFFRFFITFRYAFYFLWPMILIYKVTGTSKNSRVYKMRRTWSSVFPYVFYLSVIAFGLVHITNFNDYESYLWAMPLLTLPQLIIGIFLGYTRIKYGLRWSILFHAMHNAIFFVPVLIFEA